VPFAEYVPGASVLPGLRGLFETVSGLRLDSLRPGEGFQVWPLERWRFGVQICFEGAFPDISREIARMGASFTINISNDGWFGSSAELDQMLIMARFRAVENRIHVIRATNTGISAFIDPTGRIQARIPGKEVQGSLVATLRITEASSLFRTWGNWVAWSALLAAGARFVRSTSRWLGGSYDSKSWQSRRPRAAQASKN
jgi:apolipoprotein N-acyltransferase